MKCSTLNQTKNKLLVVQLTVDRFVCDKRATKNIVSTRSLFSLQNETAFRQRASSSFLVEFFFQICVLFLHA